MYSARAICKNREIMKQKYLTESLRYLNDIDKTAFDNMISIGSGSGEYEKNSIEELNCEITCIDPNPLIYSKQIILSPKYKYLENYLIANPNKKITTLLIIWPYPDGEHSFDEIDCIKKSSADNIIIIYEAYGGAGTDKLHYFLSKINAPSSIVMLEGNENIKYDIDIDNYYFDRCYYTTYDYIYNDEEYLEHCTECTLVTDINFHEIFRKKVPIFYSFNVQCLVICILRKK